jgi:hypothetical protein
LKHPAYWLAGVVASVGFLVRPTLVGSELFYVFFVAVFLVVAELFDGEAFDFLSDDEPVEEASDFSARSFSAAALYSLLR